MLQLLTSLMWKSVKHELMYSIWRLIVVVHIFIRSTWLQFAWKGIHWKLLLHVSTIDRAQPHVGHNVLKLTSCDMISKNMYLTFVSSTPPPLRLKWKSCITHRVIWLTTSAQNCLTKVWSTERYGYNYMRNWNFTFFLVTCNEFILWWPTVWHVLHNYIMYKLVWCH